MQRTKNPATFGEQNIGTLTNQAFSTGESWEPVVIQRPMPPTTHHFSAQQQELEPASSRTDKSTRTKKTLPKLSLGIQERSVESDEASMESEGEEDSPAEDNTSQSLDFETPDSPDCRRFSSRSTKKTNFFQISVDSTKKQGRGGGRGQGNSRGRKRKLVEDQRHVTFDIPLEIIYPHKTVGDVAAVSNCFCYNYFIPAGYIHLFTPFIPAVLALRRISSHGHIEVF